MNLPFSPSMGQKLSPFLFYKDGFGIKWTGKVDMRLHKETLETVWTLLFPHLLVKQYHHSSSTKIALVLNELW